VTSAQVRDPLTLSIPEAARLVGVSEKTVRRQVARGRFPHVRIGGRIRIPVDVVHRWLEEQARAGLVVDGDGDGDAA
jgi:excisionase family DNA binding protein